MRGRLHVLMTADAVGGVWTYACELCAALAPLGVDVTLATMGTPLGRSHVRAVAALRNVELIESRFALEWMPDPWRDVDDAGDWLLALAARCNADCVHVNGFAHAALPFTVPVVAVAHSCVLTWHRACRGADAPAEWDEYRARCARGLDGADAVVAPTAAILRAILGAHGAAPRRARVIPNGRAAREPRPKSAFVLAAGRVWDEAKGIDVLTAAAPRVPWPILVAGPRTQGDRGAPMDPPAEGIDLLGPMAPDELAELMGRASIFAAPARYEPFGLALVEAAQAGCALVASDLDTLREVWGDDAIYTPPGDAAALAAALGALAADATSREAMAARARRRALAMTPGRMAASYRALYDELCAPRAACGEVVA